MLVVAAVVATGLNAKDEVDFRVVSKEEATLLQKDGSGKEICPLCAMNLPQYYKTNFAAKVGDEIHQYCSVHCMFEEAMTEKIDIVDPQVVDVPTNKFVDAKTAYYVYGSSKPATMSKLSTYGFAKKKDAEEFAKEFGGEVINFEELSAKTWATLEDDVALVHKRQSMAAKKGEELYKAKCQKIDGKFKTSAQAKVYLMENKPCGELTPLELTQLSHYLKLR
jgi:nitrous oxide reductase accessory protein NosL